MRNLHLSTAIALVLAWASVLDAETVSGYVVNAASGEPVTQAEVAFFIKQDGDLSEIVRKPVDGEGRFAFSGPFITPQLNCLLVAFYEGVPYPSSEIQVGQQREVILEVYELTDDASQIRIVSSHLFLTLQEPNLKAFQFLQFDFPGDVGYMRLRDGARRGAEFVLPRGVFNLDSQTTNFSQADATHFFDAEPLLPGRTSISFSYELSTEQLDGGYAYQTLYPVSVMEVFLQPSSIQPGAPFSDQGTVDIQDRQYRRLRLENLQAGQRVQIPLPVSKPQRWLFKWLALGLAFCTGAGLLGRRRNRSAAERTDAPPLAPQTVDQQRQDLLQRLARLDDDYAERRDNHQYQRTRAQLMRQATTLYRLSGSEK